MASTSTQPPGPPADAQGRTATDPTVNVLALVQEAVKRLDDMSRETTRRQDDISAAENKHIRELMTMQNHYDELLRQKESERLNAIRTVDVAAVAEASRVAAAQANVLATQLVTNAETLRTQVGTVATATAIALANALEPLQKAIEDLRKTQYEQQGQKAAQVENKGDANTGRGLSQQLLGIIIAAFLAVGAICVTIIISTHK
jgi:hypothetical protein